MHEVLLPLFPLELVLLPGTVLPLHIFEDRYKEMVGQAVRDHTEFGIVQAGERGILNTGCTATVDKVLRTFPDGRMDVMAVGRRRFEIMQLNEERAYLQGEVAFFDDEDGENPPEQLRALALAAFLKLRDLDEGEPLDAPDAKDPRLSFQLARVVQDLHFRQILLNTRSETQRLKQLVDYLPAHIARQRRIAHVQRVAPQNGHGQLPPELSDCDKT